MTVVFFLMAVFISSLEFSFSGGNVFVPYCSFLFLMEVSYFWWRLLINPTYSTKQNPLLVKCDDFVTRLSQVESIVLLYAEN